jgi:hypothetical protein
MKRLSLILMTGFVVLVACKEAAKEQPQKAAPTAEKAAKTYAAEAAPTHKEVLRALLRIQDVGLAGIPSCSGAGTEPTDVNIGDYISGFMAEQDSSTGGNSIEVSAKDEETADHEHAWRGAVVIRHLDGDDRWGWGVSFLMRPTDHSVIRESVQCTGAG